LSTAKLVIPGITDENKLACIARSRKYAQYCKAVENALAGICPFCTLDRKYNVVIAGNEFWHAWPCRPPEDHTKFHFIMAPRDHLTSTSQLSGKQWSTLFDIMNKLKVAHDITSCGILIRDGNATLSAGTIEHLHVHMMVPDGTGRVESPFFKGAEAEAESLARAIVFEKLRQGADYHKLNLREQELVQGRIEHIKQLVWK